MMRPPRGSNTLLKRHGATQFDTIRAMRKVVLQDTQDPVMQEIAREIASKWPNNRVKQLQAIFDKGFQSATFEADPEDAQRIRRGGRLLQDGVANCVDYSVFNATLAVLLNIPICFVMVKFEDEFGRIQDFSHIYAQTLTEPPITLDPVLGQDQDGNEFNKPPEHRKSYFNRECSYVECYKLNLLDYETRST